MTKGSLTYIRPIFLMSLTRSIPKIGLLSLDLTGKSILTLPV